MLAVGSEWLRLKKEKGVFLIYSTLSHYNTNIFKSFISWGALCLIIIPIQQSSLKTFGQEILNYCYCWLLKCSKCNSNLSDSRVKITKMLDKRKSEQLHIHNVNKMQCVETNQLPSFKKTICQWGLCIKNRKKKKEIQSRSTLFKSDGDTRVPRATDEVIHSPLLMFTLQTCGGDMMIWACFSWSGLN